MTRFSWRSRQYRNWTDPALSFLSVGERERERVSKFFLASAYPFKASLGTRGEDSSWIFQATERYAILERQVNFVNVSWPNSARQETCRSGIASCPVYPDDLPLSNIVDSPDTAFTSSP